MRRGPDHKQGHHESPLETAKDVLATFDYRNALLQLFYEEISEDLELEAEGSDEDYWFGA